MDSKKDIKNLTVFLVISLIGLVSLGYMLAYVIADYRERKMNEEKVDVYQKIESGYLKRLPPSSYDLYYEETKERVYILFHSDGKLIRLY